MTLAKLAAAFNYLLGIEPGHFGYASRRTEPSPANVRAAARLAAVREKNKAIPMDVVETRQIRRAEERRSRKQLLSGLKAQARAAKQNGAAITRISYDREAI